MKIACILLREGGTKVQLNDPDIEYHFKPDTVTGQHVAEVKEKSHIKRLLSITEGYELADLDDTTNTTANTEENDLSSDNTETADQNKPVTLLGSDWEPTSVEYGNGQSVLTADLVTQAFDVSGLTAEQWNAQTLDEVKDRLAAEVDLLADNATNPDSLTKEGNPETPPAAPDAAPTDEKAELVKEAKALGVKSPHLYGVDKLKSEIAAAKEAK